MATIKNSNKNQSSSEVRIDHTYHDYSKIPSNGIADAFAVVSCDLFPMKLQKLLSEPKYEHIVSWMPHGRCWKIHQKREFELLVLPILFGHCKNNSFLRQVNGWAFKRITRGPDKGSYYNEFFLRGLPHICRHMVRQKRSIRKKSDPENEPDFYEISRHFPLPELNQNHSKSNRILPDVNIPPLHDEITATYTHIAPSSIPSFSSNLKKTQETNLALATQNLNNINAILTLQKIYMMMSSLSSVQQALNSFK
uniref:HSF-type DNA-binding domain-containing protein n=1 Tax=Corethron hystrix TaxID=216773 RepID=A0A7S1FXI8_9STRA|mmetsp:Transcript_37022/g.86401  ORF Transcript_37022/g.86401 Transcript_37022/m.86401 type:complete len:252 (+) Transcript_37022:33-788(+)